MHSVKGCTLKQTCPKNGQARSRCRMWCKTNSEPQRESTVQEAIIVTIKPIRETREALISMLKGMIRKTQDFPGCLTARFLDSQDRKELVIFQVWDSSEALEAYLTWRTERGDFMQINDYIEEEQVFRTYSVLV
ncbi:antibiotic biosynthesis monooxygenase family protein [Phaeobacter italicus]|uniref:putative quinol monooxygenase n=1 Tax=Phaeobacter italicus TaxID=481446 RepID=UPI002FE1FC06